MGTPVSSGNRGVLALGVSLTQLCLQEDKHSKALLLLSHCSSKPIHFYLGGKKTYVEIVNVRMSPRSVLSDHLVWIVLMSIIYRIVPLQPVRSAICSLTPWVRALSSARLVGDIRGGDSFSDIYGLRRFLFGFCLAWTAILVRGSIVHFPQTYGPYKSPIARYLARYLLIRSSSIIARDKASQRVAQELVGPQKKVILSPDVAFSLEPVVPERLELNPPLDLVPRGDALKGVIGLNVNGLMYNGGYNRKNMFELKLDYPTFLLRLIPRLLMEHHGELWLVPHTFEPNGSVESDPEASRKLYALVPSPFQSRVRLVEREYNCHEIKGVIGHCDFFIGSRMHACIAALSQGIPTVGVAYSMKFDGVFESVGMQDWVVDARDVDEVGAIDRIMTKFRSRVLVQQALRKNAKEAKQRLEGVFHDLLSQP